MMRIAFLAALLIGVGFSGYARADGMTVTAFVTSHTQIAQAAGCANKCMLAASQGGATCDLAQATGSSCVPVGSGCSCLGQSVGGGMGVVVGTAVRQ